MVKNFHRNTRPYYVVRLWTKSYGFEPGAEYVLRGVKYFPPVFYKKKVASVFVVVFFLKK